MSSAVTKENKEVCSKVEAVGDELSENAATMIVTTNNVVVEPNLSKKRKIGCDANVDHVSPGIAQNITAETSEHIDKLMPKSSADILSQKEIGGKQPEGATLKKFSILADSTTLVDAVDANEENPTTTTKYNQEICSNAEAGGDELSEKPVTIIVATINEVVEPSPSKKPKIDCDANADHESSEFAEDITAENSNRNDKLLPKPLADNLSPMEIGEKLPRVITFKNVGILAESTLFGEDDANEQMHSAATKDNQEIFSNAEAGGDELSETPETIIVTTINEMVEPSPSKMPKIDCDANADHESSEIAEDKTAENSKHNDKMLPKPLADILFRKEIDEKQPGGITFQNVGILAESTLVDTDDTNEDIPPTASKDNHEVCFNAEAVRAELSEKPVTMIVTANNEVVEPSPRKKPKNDYDANAGSSEIGADKKAETSERNDKLLPQPSSDNLSQKEVSEKQPGGITLKNYSISLKSQAHKAETDASDTNRMPAQLLTVISNLYLNVGDRLRLNFLPRCLDDLGHCHRHHYHAELPEAPITSQAHNLRSALQHYRYVSFINSAIDMCHRGEFPGKGILTKIIELVLSINYDPKQQTELSLQQSYQKSIDLFSMIVRTFPPCWHKIRTYYIGFLEYGLDESSLGNNLNEPMTKSSKIFDIILDLLEEVLQKATSAQLSTSASESLQTSFNETPATISKEHASPLQNSMDLTICSDYWNQNEYEERERQKQTFRALTMIQKIERIFMCLRLLLEVLENDLAMWMLHHFKKTKEWIFCSDNRPLIVVLCELTQYTRMTRVARRIFSVYSEAASKGLYKGRLQVLERFISLLMVASNTADMENTAIGVKYPSLGEQTKTLIKEFFKIFKVHNREDISKYTETIELLRIPYVRFEFIDNVLFTNTEPLTPQKIAHDMARKRWLKYKPICELKPNEEISREQYLHLLLDALRQYCEWHGLKTFLHVITDSAQISNLSTTNDSVHRWPTRGTGVLVLKKMAKVIRQLETQLKMSVRMSKPKVNISLADIYIDEAIILKYRTDLKFVLILQNVLVKQRESHPEVDFSEWLEYLNEFSPKKNVKTSDEQQTSLQK